MKKSKNSSSPAGRKRRFPWNLPLRTRAILGGGIVLAIVLFLHIVPDFVVNRIIKDQVIADFAKAYPKYTMLMAGMHYSIWENRVWCDSVSLTAVDSTLSCTIASFSVWGIRRWHFIHEGKLGPDDLLNAIVHAREIVCTLPDEQYRLRCGALKFSIADSVASVNALTLQPTGTDEEFFAGSRFRRTRFRVDVPHGDATGIAWLALLEGGVYRTRSARIDDGFLDILINKEKPREHDSARPPMPQEILSSMEGIVQIDSLSFLNGRMEYRERFMAGYTAALLTLDEMDVLVEGISNQGEPAAPMVIHARGNFMKAGVMNILMSIPVTSPEFSYQFSGSLGRMELSALDTFLAPAEQMRIKTGDLRAATFAISVTAGHATGYVRAVYRDMILAAIDKRTGSEKGFLDVLSSFMANTFSLRGTNVADSEGIVKMGKVDYTKKRDEFFLEFSWFALRSGLGDIVGF